MPNESTSWLDYLPDVLFYENDLLGDPLYITTMVTPPRIGETFAIPRQPFDFVGRVKIVGWAIEEGRLFCSIILERV